MVNFSIFDEIFVNEKIPFKEEPAQTEKKENDDTNLFKIPKYLETCVFFGTSMLINAIIFNMIIVPLKTIYMLILRIFKRTNNIKLSIYSVKLFILLTGVIIKKMLENSFPIFLIHHKLRSLSGMKIYSFIRIIEFMNILVNKFNKDYDLQLVKIIKQNKFKKKLISFFILLTSLCLNIVTFWCYIISLSIALNDSNNFIYPLFMKLNFVEIKKSGKIQKKKKIYEIITNEIYDRFLALSCLGLVVFQNYSENKLNSHNFVDYSYRVLFLVGCEIVFDWIKDVIIFKISTFKSNVIKTITFELVLYHEKLKFNSFARNGNGINTNTQDEPLMKVYLDYIDKAELKYLNNKLLLSYTPYLDHDNILCVAMENNILIHCIIFFSLIVDKIKSLCLIKIILFILILLIIRKIIQCLISNYIIDRINLVNTETLRKSPARMSEISEDESMDLMNDDILFQ